MTKKYQTNDVDSAKENKLKLPLFFWVGVSLLFLISFLWAFKLSFLSVVLISVIWLLFVFIIKKFSFTLIVSIFSLIIIFIFSIVYLMFFVSDRQDIKNNNITAKSSSNLKVKENVPILEMNIIKSPQVINCDDEVSVLEVEAKNVGKKALSFNEVSNHKYDFGICDSDKGDKKGSSCFSLMNGYLKIDNFGEIKVGETKTIKFITPNKYSNAITSFNKSAINGEYKYYISFQQIKSPKLKPTLSKSNIFTVQTNIMNSANEYIKVDCRKNR